MVGTPPTITDTQDLHRRMHLLPQAAINIVEFIYKGANKHQKAKLQSKIKQRLMAKTSRTSMMKKKLQEEACLPHQHCISRHQHSLNRRKIKKRDRDNRS